MAYLLILTSVFFILGFFIGCVVLAVGVIDVVKGDTDIKIIKTVAAMTGICFVLAFLPVTIYELLW